MEPVADQAVVVAENVLVGDSGVGFPIVFDHVLDRRAHGPHVDDDPGRSEQAVAGGVVEREAQFAFLLDDGRGGDFFRGFARIHDARAQAREQFVVEDGFTVAQFEFTQSGVMPAAFGRADDAVAVGLEGLAAAHDAGARGDVELGWRVAVHIGFLLNKG